MTQVDRLGGKLGPRLARIVADAVVDTQHRMTAHKVAVGRESINEALGTIGSEITQHTGRVFQQIADHEQTPPWMRDLLHFVARGSGQAAGLLASMSVGQISAPLSTLINNAVSQGVQAAIREMGPALPVDPGTAAQLAARRLQPEADMAHEAAGQGIDGSRFAALVALAEQHPDLSAVLQLVNRDVLSLADGERALQLLGFTDESVGLLLQLRHQIPTPPDLALGVLRGNIDETRARDLAAANGVGTEDFDLMVGNTGEPLGLAQLLEAFRRGIIDQPRLVRGIRQSRVRNEWADVAEALRYAPPPVGTVVSAVVENQLPNNEGQRLAEQAGLDPQHFDWIVRTHGRPPGTEQMLELLNRGVATEDEVRQSIRESDVKNKYVDHILQMRYRLPPERTVVSMLRHGVITRARGERLLHQLGYFPDDVQALLDEASADKTAASRDLTVAQLTDLYVLAAITRDTFTRRLQQLGYDQAEAAQLAEIADLRAKARLTAQATTVVRAKYVTRHIDRTTASTQLDTLAVPHGQRDDLLALWDLERDANARTLTEAQVAAAAKKGLIAPADALARWKAMGYSDVDVAVLAALAGIG